MEDVVIPLCVVFFFGRIVCCKVNYNKSLIVSFYHLFLGEVDAPDKENIRGLENENEDIFVKSYSYEEVKEKLEKKKILNGLTLIALQWFFLNIYKS